MNILIETLLKNIDQCRSLNSIELLKLSKEISLYLKDDNCINTYQKNTNEPFLHKKSYIIFSLIDTFGVTPLPLEEKRNNRIYNYKLFVSRYKSLLSIFFKKNEKNTNIDLFLIDVAYHYPTVFWVTLEFFLKQLNENEFINLLKNIPKISSEKMHLVDFYLLNYNTSKNQININLSKTPKNTFNKFFNIVSKHSLYTINPLEQLLYDYNNSNPFINKFIELFPITVETLALSIIKETPRWIVKKMIDLVPTNMIQSQQTDFKINYLMKNYCVKYVGKRIKTGNIRQFSFSLNNDTLFEVLYENNYKIQKELISNYQSEFKFIQSNLFREINLKKRDNYIFNKEISNLFKKYKNIKPFIKCISGFQTPMMTKYFMQNLYKDNKINESFILSLLDLKKALKGKKHSHEQFIKIHQSKNFQQLYLWFIDKTHRNSIIRMLNFFSLERITILMTKNEDNPYSLLKDSASMFNNNITLVKKALNKMNFNRYNSIKKLHDEISLILKYFYQKNKNKYINDKFINKTTKNIFNKYNNIKSNKYTLILPKDRLMLMDWSAQLNHCIGTSRIYGDNFIRGLNVLYGVYNGKELVATLEIIDHKINQFKVNSNNDVSQEMFDEVKTSLFNHKIIEKH